MAEILSTVSPGGDQGTPANGGQRYVSLTAWEAAQQSDLTGSSNPGGEPSSSTVECYTFSGGLEEVGVFNMGAGWGTSATNTVTVKAASGHEHKGVPESGFYMTRAGQVLQSNSNYIYFEDMEFVCTSGDTTLVASTLGTDPCFFNRCIIRNDNGTSLTANALSTFNNCVFRTGFRVNNNSEATYRNCDFIAVGSADLGLLNSGTVVNCVVYGFSGNDVNNNTVSFTYTALSASSRGTDGVDGVIHNIPAESFIDLNGGNYNPTPGGALDGTGTDLSGTFTDDITGQTRTQWDIGAYGIISGAAGFDDTNAFTITIAPAGVSLNTESLSQAQTIGTVELDQGHQISIGAITQAQTIGTVEVDQDHQISIGAITQLQSIADVSIDQAHLISLNAVEQGQGVDSVDLVAAGLLALDAIQQGQSIESVALSQNYQELALDAIEQAQRIDETSLSSAVQLLIDAVQQAQSLNSVPITSAGILVPSGISQSQRIDDIDIGQANILALREVTQEQIVTSVRLGGLVVGKLDGELTIFVALEGELTIQ